MDLHGVVAFMREHRYAVVATCAPDGRVQAATVGIAVTVSGDVIFDTLAESRKAANLRRHSAIAITVGSLAPGASVTVQYEGVAEFPTGPELEATRAEYFQVFPDGVERARVSGIVHVRVRPRWVRYSDFATEPPTIYSISMSDAAGPSTEDLNEHGTSHEERQL